MNDQIADNFSRPPATEHPAQPTEISLPLTGSTRIVARLNGDAENPRHNEGWSSIDIYAEHPNGWSELLCCAEISSLACEGKGFNRFRVMSFQPDKEEPSVILEPLEHRSIWLILEEGTYDIDVWNEDSDERDHTMGENHIPFLDEVTKKMESIIAENPQIVWTIRNPRASAYSCKLLTCVCCGVQILEHSANEERGAILECAECCNHFCTQCFVDHLGTQAYRDMVNSEEATHDNNFLCPRCYSAV